MGDFDYWFVNKIERLYEKHNFDYVYINAINIENLMFEHTPEELYVDNKTPVNYIGLIKIKDRLIPVYYNEKATYGSVTFKYKTIKKERKAKIDNLQSDLL